MPRETGEDDTCLNCGWPFKASRRLEDVIPKIVESLIERRRERANAPGDAFQVPRRG